MAQHVIGMHHPAAPHPSHTGKPMTCTKLERIPRAKLAEFIANRSDKERRSRNTTHFKPEALSSVEHPKTRKWTAPVLEKQPDIAKRLASAFDTKPEALERLFRRAAVEDTTLYPWCTIGKVFGGYSIDDRTTGVMLGSGVLVGPNVMLTASHVVPWGKPNPVMRFVPAFLNPDPYTHPQEPFGSAGVTEAYGIENDDSVVAWDYVICHLDTPLGNNCGWMGTQDWYDDDNYMSRHWISVGYPGDSFQGQVPMVEMDLAVDHVDDEDDGNYKKLQCNQQYGSNGWSGGPLWNFLAPGEPYVVGVHSGHEDNWILLWGRIDDASAGGLYMVNLVKWALVNWPA